MNNTDLFRLDNKHVIITGAGSGIGQSIARLFAERGALIHILDINQDTGKQTVNTISDEGGKAFFHLCDVTKQEEVVALVEKLGQEHNLDILVNNAGVGFVGNLENTDEITFDRLYNINVKGVYNCMFACISKMKAQRNGVILNMASVVSKVGIPDRFAYTMTKGAVLTMTYSVAMDYINYGIRCNAISPARIHTPFVDDFLAKNYPGKEQEMYDALAATQPIGRMGTPDEVAKLALFLCSDEAGFITGSNYAVDGGFTTLVPQN